MDINGKASSPCSRCEALPKRIEGNGSLYLWFPVSHTLNKVLPALQKAQFKSQLLEAERCLRILLDIELTEKFNTLLLTKLTPKELKETQALWMKGLQEPGLYDFSRITSLDNFINLSRSDWLLDLLTAEHLTSYFQPIVYASDTSRIFAQEALLRGIDRQGNLIPPGRIFAQAESAGLIFQLDALARASAIREARKYGLQETIFINFSPTSVYDPTTCLRMTVRAIDEAGIPHENIVFEVAESEQPADIAHLIKILKFYQDAGFLIALDDFGNGYSNLNLIHQLRPDFVKLDMHLIRNVHQDAGKALITEKLLEIANHLEIKTIAEGVETLEELHWVRERGALFVQGFLIARPSSPPIASLSHLKDDSIPDVA